MTKNELFEYINTNKSNLENERCVDNLLEFRCNVNKLKDILPAESAEARAKAKELKFEIEECKRVIESNTLELRGLNKDISGLTSDIHICDQLLVEIKNREEKVRFENAVEELLRETQPFERAVHFRIKVYGEDLFESLPFTHIDAKDLNLGSAYDVADSYLKPDRRFPMNQDWHYAKKTYERYTRELCEAEVKKAVIPKAKYKSRFDVIDKLIEQYEEQLFKNVKTR